MRLPYIPRYLLYISGGQHPCLGRNRGRVAGPPHPKDPSNQGQSADERGTRQRSPVNGDEALHPQDKGEPGERKDATRRQQGVSINRVGRQVLETIASTPPPPPNLLD